MKTFFSDDDYQYYLALLSKYKVEAGVDIWAYCLMPNHTHIVAVPSEEDSLAKLFRSVHRHYSRYINFREKWVGHLWQERFHSFVMDETYLMATVRYVELNPLKARLCQNLSDWQWSSYHAHVSGFDDDVVIVEPMLKRITDWNSYVLDGDDVDSAKIRSHNRTGRPVGDDAFLDRLESLTGRSLRKRKPGPKTADNRTVVKLAADTT